MLASDPAGRVYIGMLGLDQHEAGALTVARLLADAGFEVVYGGRFNVPATVARASLEEDVDLVGLSCHSWEYLYYVDELLAALRDLGHQVPVVLGGSVITQSDAQALRDKGIAATFGSSSSPVGIVSEIRRLIGESRDARCRT